MPIIVDENEPLVDVEDPPFEPRDVTVRKDRWVDKDFEVLDFLGRGKFGEVKRCRERSTNQEFAAKFICAPGRQEKEDVEQEVEIMKKLQHKRLLQLYDAYQARDEMCLVLEIILGGELFDRVIDDDFILTERACVVFMRQICEGVEYMHSKNIIHLDMKPENILCLTKTGNRIKIIDFGLARQYDPHKELRVLFGTPEFMAPEVCQYERIDFSTDMWSIGVICYVLLSGLSPFMGDNDNETLSNVIRGKYSFNHPEFSEVSDEAKDLMTNLLVKDPSKRLTATQCLQHIWLRKREKSRTPSLNMSKKRLKKFVYRRKWQKIVNAIIALKRMGVAPKALRRRSVMAQLHQSPVSESIFGWPVEKQSEETNGQQEDTHTSTDKEEMDNVPSILPHTGQLYSRDSSHHTNSTDSGVDFTTDSPEEVCTIHSVLLQPKESTHTQAKDSKPEIKEQPKKEDTQANKQLPRLNFRAVGNKEGPVSKVEHFRQKFANSREHPNQLSTEKPVAKKIQLRSENIVKFFEAKANSEETTSEDRTLESGKTTGGESGPKQPPKILSTANFAKFTLFKPKTNTCTAPKPKVNIYR